MLLGGLRYLIPVIEAAHKQGYYVITCDYLPDNIAHQYSDEYCNISILDKEAVLAVAREKEIDGIMSFAVDPGVVTAAYVQEQMGLPAFGPYESVCILQNKDRFRAFLAEHGFNVPKAKSFSSVEDARRGLDGFEWPLIVKPTDSAGSKGVTKVDSVDELDYAVSHALDHSHCKRVIVEEFIEQEGCSSDSDCFSVVGELKFADSILKRWLLVANEKNTPEKVEEDYPQIIKDLTYHLIKESIVKDNEIKVEDADVETFAKRVAKSQFAQYGMLSVPEDVLDNYAKDMLKNTQTLQNIIERAVEEKIAAWLKEQVELEEKEVSTEEFNKLFEQ